MKLQVGVKVLIKQYDKYLFLRRSATFQQGAQKWDIPGGKIEPEEALQYALTREVVEETGLKLEQIDKLLAAQDIFVSNADVHVVRLTYMGAATGEMTISDEHDDHVWMTISEALSEPYVDRYLREVLEIVHANQNQEA